MISRATEQVTSVARQGLDAVREGTQQVRDGARRASDSALGYVRDEPVKAMLIAAAAGAALMLVARLMTQPRDRR